METVVEVEEGGGNKVEESVSAIVIDCCQSSKQIADPVVYKLARVVGDGIYIPATDDEVMKAEDLIDHNSSLHFVLDNSRTAVCTSNDDTFGPEFMPIDCEGLLDFEDPSTQGERTDTVFETTVDLGKLNPRFEEVTRSEAIPIEQSGDRSQADPVPRPAESAPSLSTICASWKPDFFKLKGEICLDNLSVKELHATFKATFGRETSVKDKQWLKRRISMGLSNSCDFSVTTFNIENNEVKKNEKIEGCNKIHEDLNKDSFTGPGGGNVSGDDKILVGQSQTNQMEDHISGGSKSVQSDSPKHHIALEDDSQGNKRVRKPTRRYIEEVSESDSREYSGRPVSSVRSSGNGPRTRVRSLHNIQPIRRPLVTRQDSLGGSGVEVPYVSRIRRGRPRENFMSLMKFQPNGMGMTRRLVKKAHDGHDRRSDNDIENQELKATPATGWPLQYIKEPRENEQYSEQSTDLNNNSDEGHMDSYADVDSDETILTVPTAKGGMRRKHHRPWTLSEVVKLVEGVSRYGAGRWSEIKRIAFATCSHRTSVDLKDKWRNLLRASFAQLPADKGVQNSKKHPSIPIPAPILLRVRELAEMHSQVSPDLKAVKFNGHSGSRNVNDMKSGFL
ncbi:hypothetical protein QVD17_26040 [Tagetes erecta]|uniref:Uncharacterized protein n=1 Tax=Tagetes erecta TaxID=13708 RepID=A0AAD8K9E4_TARER|nr:hypothetical protein QVD17_26040 [Tagetes erecta]